jgi:chaperone BCS1
LLVLHCDVKEHREDLRISSISLNANILKILIEECREKYIKNTQRKVSVFENREGEWKKARLRPVRPISTVIIDNEVKDNILRDVDEFLDQDMQG